MPADPSEPDWFGEESVAFDESTFSGIGRLFPLAGVSLFPGIVQPLHVFEERYRALMRDALDSDGLITMAVLRPGWEPDYEGRPPLEKVGCLGKIVTHHRLEDGRYNLLLAGLRRVRIEHEIEPPEAFRRAAVRLIEESQPDAADPRIAQLRGGLADAFRGAFPSGEAPEPLSQLADSDTPLGVLADLVAFALPLPHAAKRAALLEADIARRAEALLAVLQPPPGGESDDEAGGEGFPPPFSVN